MSSLVAKYLLETTKKNRVLEFVKLLPRDDFDRHHSHRGQENQITWSDGDGLEE